MPVETTGTRLADRYRILKLLGSGGMATVFLCEDERLGRRVAVKRMHAHSPEDVARRFAREARLGALLNQPNIVSVYDTVTDGESVLIVMEYVEGETLAQALGRGPLGTRRSLEVVKDVAAALDHAHSLGVVHRDVKPANVLLRRDGVAKLVDLGIATAADATQITRAGIVLGTAAYMAPEQLESRPATPASDVYSLATVAYEAFAGRKARSGRTPVEIAHRVATEPIPDVRAVWPQAPPGVADALARGMAVVPAERPRSAGELADELARAVLAGDGSRAPAAAAAARPAPSAPQPEPGTRRPEPSARQPEPGTRRPKPSAALPPVQRARRRLSAGLAAAALAAVALVVGVVLLLMGGGDDDRSAQRERSPAAAERRAERGSASSRRSSEGGAGAAAGAAQEAPAGAETGAAGGAGEAAAPAPAPTPAPAPSTDTTPAVPSPPAGGGGSAGGSGGGGASQGARLNQEGFALMNQGRYDEAVAVLQRAVAAFPSGTTDVAYAYALYNLGRSLRLAGRPAEAIPVLERRLRIPNQADVVRRELEAAKRAAPA